MSNFNPQDHWNFASSFFKYLNEKSTYLFENLWKSFDKIGIYLTNQAQRFLDTEAPENSQVSPKEYYYEILFGPLYSRPTFIDAADLSKNYRINPRTYYHTEAKISDDERIYDDIIEISNQDYYKIREIGLDNYVVIDVNNSNIDRKYFKIKQLLSSEEDPAGVRYILPGNLLNQDTYKYYIVLDNGNLDYIGTNTFSFYLTNSRVYSIDKRIEDISTVRTSIELTNHEDEIVGREFVKGTDFDFEDNYLEFYNDILEKGYVKNGDILYVKEADSVEYNIYNMYGNMVGLPNWYEYNYDNVLGKASINGLLKSLQNSNNIIDYQRALHIYYGIPVCPEDSLVMGLFESYDYEIISIDNSSDTITVELDTGAELHKFIGENSKLYVFEKDLSLVVDSVSRTLGEITLFSGVTNDLEVGDKFNVQLPNRFKIKDIEKNSSANSCIYIDLSYNNPNIEAIKHIYNIVYNLSLINDDEEARPEIILYGTENFSINYNGVYHISGFDESKVSSEGLLGIKISDYVDDNEEPLYNDYIKDSASDIDGAFLHIPWPTHKYLYLYLKDSKTNFKAYIDSPLDTIYDEEDQLSKYDMIIRSINVMNRNLFPGWNEYDGFRLYNGIHLESNLLELINTISYISFGEYFPQSYELE